MNWTEILLAAGTGVAGVIAGATLGPMLRGKPPAPRSAWEDVDRKIDEKRVNK